MTRVKLRDKLGMHSSDTATLYFEGVRVPQRYRIGDEGRGFVYQMEQFQEERLHGAAGSLRGMERAIAQTIEHTSQRVAFGGPLLDNQIIQFKLAELQTKVELLRSITYRAVEEYVARRQRHAARVDGEAHRRAPRARGRRQLPAVLRRDGLHERDADRAVLPRFPAALDRARAPTRSCSASSRKG